MRLNGTYRGKLCAAINAVRGAVVSLRVGLPPYLRPAAPACHCISFITFVLAGSPLSGCSAVGFCVILCYHPYAGRGRYGSVVGCGLTRFPVFSLEPSGHSATARRIPWRLAFAVLGWDLPGMLALLPAAWQQLDIVQMVTPSSIMDAVGHRGAFTGSFPNMVMGAACAGSPGGGRGRRSTCAIWRISYWAASPLWIWLPASALLRGLNFCVLFFDYRLAARLLFPTPALFRAAGVCCLFSAGSRQTGQTTYCWCVDFAGTLLHGRGRASG